MRHADYALVPVVKLPATPRNSWRDVVELSQVGDWTTLCLTAYVDWTFASAALMGVCVQVNFYQLSGMSTIPSYSNAVPVGGRSMCVGLNQQRTFFTASTLAVRLPIIAPFVSIQVFFPTNQTGVTALNIGAWCTNDPSYQYGNPAPSGYFTSPISAGDSILGWENSGYLLDTARGIYVPAGTSVGVELETQTIGTGYFSFIGETVAGAPLAAGEMNTYIANKAPDDITGTTIDQLLYEWVGATSGRQGGIPLTAFRQSVIIQNVTAPARDLVSHWTVYPEFA